MRIQRQVSVVPIDPAKLQDGTDLRSDDEEVCVIPNRLDLPSPYGVDDFVQIVDRMLMDAYSPAASAHTGLVTAKTHTGIPPSDLVGSGSNARGAKALVRTTSREPELELETSPFLQRSAIFLRVKQPYKWGRGYGARSQPFKQQDIQAWKCILAHNWTSVVGNDIDLVAFINHSFETDFTRDLLQNMCLLDPKDDSFDDIIAGSAVPFRQRHCTMCTDAATAFSMARCVYAHTAIDIGSKLALPVEECMKSSTSLEKTNHQLVEWHCRFCKDDDGNPTSNVPVYPTDRQQSARQWQEGGNFCCKCSTSRDYGNLWFCKGPGSVRCNQVMQMRDVPLGVPCCKYCGTVRNDYHLDYMFNAWSNDEDEPLPRRSLKCE